jgi:hypothetical protein
MENWLRSIETRTLTAKLPGMREWPDSCESFHPWITGEHES